MPFLGNSILDNAGLAIDLAGGTRRTPSGSTANDTGDGDTGPNDLLNHPVITAISEAGGLLTVDYTLDVPAGTYRIEFFDNAEADDSGHGEAQTYARIPDRHPHRFRIGTVLRVIQRTGNRHPGRDPRPRVWVAAATEPPPNSRSPPAWPPPSTRPATPPTPTPGDHLCDTGATNTEGDAECNLAGRDRRGQRLGDSQRGRLRHPQPPTAATAPATARGPSPLVRCFQM